MARRSLIALGVSLTLLSAIGTAEAAGKKDADATKLVDQAMNEDYLNVQLDAAEAKLQKAVKTCGTDQCSPEVVGKIYIALATVHGLGQNKMEVAKGDFAKALAADPNAKLIDGLSSPEFEAAFKAAKEANAGAGGSTGTAGTGGKAGTGGEAGTGGTAGTGGAQKPQGDFTHTPVAEGLVNTPLPIFAEIPDEIGASKVIARYKPYGGSKWETLPLQKMKGGFGAMVPCEQVETTGDFKYYIIATDDSGLELAGAGKLSDPFKVPIKSKIAGDPPSLPDQPAPKQCMAKGECPPGLLGCGAGGGTGDKVEGQSCDASTECQEGLICTEGVCASNGEEKPKHGGKKNLISLSAQFDFDDITDGTHVCDQGRPGGGTAAAIRNNALANYTCAVPDGYIGPDNKKRYTFYGQPSDVKGTDGIAGGVSPGNIRLLLGYDRILPLGFTLGARLGYSFRGYPSPDDPPDSSTTNGIKYIPPNAFLPVHFEVRGGWMLAKDGVKKGMVVPHAFLGGGVGTEAASVPVTVCDAANTDQTPPECPGKRTVDAYQITGTGFVDFGGGVAYMIVDNFGIQAEMKFMIQVPTVGFSFSPVIAPVVAF